MPDLKLTVEECRAHIAQIEADCHKLIARSAEDALASFSAAVNATGALEHKSGTDLLLKSALAASAEMDFTERATGYPKGQVLKSFGVRVDLFGSSSYEVLSREEREIPAGKYRALFFLIPVDE